MLYTINELQRQWMGGASLWAGATARAIQNPLNPWAQFGALPVMAHALDVFAHSTEARGKPDFGLTETVIDGETVLVTEEIVDAKPFGQLKRFAREGRDDDPKLLIVAPMSGHFATLLRGTVERLLPGHDLHITDWHDAKHVSLDHGGFDLDDYIDYVIDWLAVTGPGAHVLAVCQPSVPVYAAVALMNADDHPAAPATLTMMGGPIDTREAPTAVNLTAQNRPFSWFEQTVIATVPAGYKGAGRKVYPGFLQLAGFMSMNLGNHLTSHYEMFKHLVEGDESGADLKKGFYDEYRSVCDMAAEFYLQTIDVVFQRHALPKGEMTHRGRPVDPAAITRTALMAVEGERDDISGLGQTKAALTIATGLAEEKKRYLMADGAGHYGIFNGSKWRDRIAPAVEAFVREFGG